MQKRKMAEQDKLNQKPENKINNKKDGKGPKNNGNKP